MTTCRVATKMARQENAETCLIVVRLIMNFRGDYTWYMYLVTLATLTGIWQPRQLLLLMSAIGAYYTLVERDLRFWHKIITNSINLVLISNQWVLLTRVHISFHVADHEMWDVVCCCSFMWLLTFSVSSLPVNVKWGKEKFDGVELNTEEPPVVFKAQLFALTGVQPDRQKVMVKGGTLKVHGQQDLHPHVQMSNPGSGSFSRPL